MTERHPGWKLWLGMLAIVIGMGLLSIVTSVRLADENAARQIRAAQAAATESRRVTCELAGSMLDGYAEQPPPTPTGKVIAEKWLEQYRILGCLPSR